MQVNHKSCLLHRKKFLWNLVKLAFFFNLPADKKRLKEIVVFFVKKKVSLVKKHHLIYDWLTYVLTRDMQIWQILEPKLLPGGSNLNCLSRVHISIRRQNNVDLITCSRLAFSRQSWRWGCVWPFPNIFEPFVDWLLRSQLRIFLVEYSSFQPLHVRM